MRCMVVENPVRMGFNRYMVECELIYHKSTFFDNKF